MNENIKKIEISRSEFEFSFARGSGPGGQNVNKVNSKAIMRWNASSSPSLPEDVRARFLKRYASRLTAEGILIVSSQVHRDQPRNIEECVRRVEQMVQSVAAPPKPRLATKPTAASKYRRVEDKRHTSQKKQSRREYGWEQL